VDRGYKTGRFFAIFNPMKNFILLLICFLSFSVFADVDEIIIYKETRKMFLMEDGNVLREYNIRLSAKHNNPFFMMGPKRLRGDNRTPEGLYKVQRKVTEDWSRFNGSLLINYPNKKDIEWGKANGYSVKELGDAIQIHGTPRRVNKALKEFALEYLGWMIDDEEELDAVLKKYLYPFVDWTNGCVAVSDEEMEEIMELVKVGTPIKIYRRNPSIIERLMNISPAL
jgi:murein L,D-transpeptidase YafK